MRMIVLHSTGLLVDARTMQAFELCGGPQGHVRTMQGDWAEGLSRTSSKPCAVANALARSQNAEVRSM